jgi:hypothetical protein
MGTNEIQVQKTGYKEQKKAHEQNRMNENITSSSIYTDF